MKMIHRVVAEYTGVLAIPSSRAWELLKDWGGILKWWDGSTESDSMYLESVSLEGQEDEIPRTRLIVRGNTAAAGIPKENRETLLLEDDEMMRIYYDADDNVLPGVTNYMATTYIDEVDAKSCRLNFRSSFDVPSGYDHVLVRNSIVSIYVNIHEGFQKYFAKT